MNLSFSRLVIARCQPTRFRFLTAVSLRVLENWSSVIALTKATAAAESSKTPSELVRTPL